MTKLIDTKSSLYKEKEPYHYAPQSRRETLFGRSPDSWAKILLFYLVFYSFLGGFFAVLFGIFYQTVDTQFEPTYQSGESSLVNPSLGFRPYSNESVLSTLIRFRSDIDRFQPSKDYVRQLDAFISSYEGTDDNGQDIRDCKYDTYRQEKRENRRPKKYCRFRDTWIKSSKYILVTNTNYCHKAEYWGFRRNSPCMLLKVNKMDGWEPDVYTDDDINNLPKEMPRFLKDYIKFNEGARHNGTLKEMVWISCGGENPADIEYLTNIDYFPEPGFPAYYFPYKKNDAYRSPLVAVQFSNPVPHVVINVECRLWAKNIIHDRRNKLGLVHFELLRD